jgi:hypothetical protein
MTPWPVVRWHCHPNEKLRNSGDCTFGHGDRCRSLAMDLWPNASAELLRACVQHDFGECITGDLPYSIKRAHPELRAMVSLLETQALASFGIAPWKLTDDECRMLKLVDLLDPYLWVIHCDAMEEFAKDEWRPHFGDMLALADHLGVRALVLEIINEAEKQASRREKGERDELRAEIERLRGFIRDFAEADFPYYGHNPRDPQDELDPLTDYLTVAAWQSDARELLKEKAK